jgi:hypothetical protein
MLVVPRLQRSTVLAIRLPALPGWAEVWLPALRAWVRFGVYFQVPGDSGMPDEIWRGDRWYSPELQLVLINARTPRPGETTKVELKKIRLVEPDPDLFKSPDGYQLVKEQEP